MPTYAQICVDISHTEVDRLFCYAIPPTLVAEATIGKRVQVPFGKGQSTKTGYIMEVSDTNPSPDINIKEIVAVHDAFSVLTEETIQLALWMQKKYYTTLAACIRCIVPSAKADGSFAGTRSKHNNALPIPRQITLTAEQQTAVDIIARTDSPVLLHGITGSGKTEVYLHAIDAVLTAGRDAIVLVPEIALTPQMVGLFTERFGGQVAVTHSRMTSGERFKIWHMARMGEIKLIIGPRSAIFAPFADLGLIVIDEEHEHTYHSETAPKYDTREVAVKRGELSGAAVVLGSATPSLESYYKATTLDQYKLTKLTTRINNTLPQINVIDMRGELRKGNTSNFSAAFIDALSQTLEAGQQAILFLNRRGYSSSVCCRNCGYVCGCDSCRVNHTYHADNNRLMCHYCGKSVAMPKTCPECGSPHIKKYGMGTQKIQEEISAIFPDAKILRMDMDTTRGKHGHAKILDAFRKGEAQILIGTQMVAKGLDFPNVTMVGVVAADLSLNAGDFRAGEHTFQLLTQVAGRAGRAENLGRVYIQTYNPQHYSIALAEKGDYEAFYNHETTLRSAMIYPPYSHVFCVMFTGPAERDVIAALRKLAAIMEYANAKDGKDRFQIIGFSPAFVSMIKKQFRWKLLVKCTDETTLTAFVLYCIKKLKQNDPLKNLTTHLTLNPIIME